MALLPVLPDAGKAGGRDLRGERDAVRDVLLRAEQEDREDDQPSARTDAEQTRGEPADEADRDA